VTFLDSAMDYKTADPLLCSLRGLPIEMVQFDRGTNIFCNFLKILFNTNGLETQT
jgi:hypothetical protein